jgi:hypothetical protein
MRRLLCIGVALLAIMGFAQSAYGSPAPLLGAKTAETITRVDGVTYVTQHRVSGSTYELTMNRASSAWASPLSIVSKLSSDRTASIRTELPDGRVIEQIVAVPAVTKGDCGGCTAMKVAGAVATVGGAFCGPFAAACVAAGIALIAGQELVCDNCDKTKPPPAPKPEPVDPGLCPGPYYCKIFMRD